MIAPLISSGYVSAVPHLHRRPSPSSTYRCLISTSLLSPSIANKDRPSFGLTGSSSFLLDDRNQGRRRIKVKALNSDEVPHPIVPIREESSLREWDWWTTKFAAAANVPFLLLQLPQIILNFRNLQAGNKSALLAIPWLGILTGMLGNLALLSYFVKKRESEAVAVQTLGVISMYVVILQLAMGDAMPFGYFAITSVVVAVGLASNCLRYFGLLPSALWHLWEDFTTIGGLSVLAQVMWSTFTPYVPPSILPGSIAFLIAVATIWMAKMGKLSPSGNELAGSISGWTATLLFMWMPIAQFWTNYLNPENIKGLSAFSMLLAIIGNALLIPRALFIRDLMWFTGSTWATLLYGWGNLVCMYWFRSISKDFFLATTIILFLWIGMTFWKDKQVHGYDSALGSLKDLVRQPKNP